METRRARPRIGFIGMGNMGSRMARRLLEAGYPVTVYNRTRDRTQPLVERGAGVAASPRDLAAESDVVLSSVADDAALQATMLGPDGALEAARPGMRFIDTSTVFPGTSRQVHAAAQAKGASLIDAPVSGTTIPAEQGTLLIFVGGEPHVYQECQPILDVLAKQTFYMGPSGSGVATKLVVNTILGVALQGIAEGVALGQKAGLDKGLLLDVLGQTAVIPPGLKAKLENARREEYPVTFTVELMVKDFGLILRQAAALAVPMPATAVAQQMCSAEHARGIEEDYGAVIRLMESLAGLATGE